MAFGVNIQTLQDENMAIVGGFALKQGRFYVNSGAFNTHAHQGHEDNYMQDSQKCMSTKEAQFVVGSFHFNTARGWKNDEITLDEAYYGGGRQFIGREKKETGSKGD